MTVRERVLMSSLIEKIDCLEDYANQIGLSGRVDHNEYNENRYASVENKRKNYSLKKEN